MVANPFALYVYFFQKGVMELNSIFYIYKNKSYDLSRLSISFKSGTRIVFTLLFWQLCFNSELK